MELIFQMKIRWPYFGTFDNEDYPIGLFYYNTIW